MRSRMVRRCLISAAASGMLLLAGCNGGMEMTEGLSVGAEHEVYDISGDYSRLDSQAELADVTVQSGSTASMEVRLEDGYEIEQTVEDDTLYLTEMDRKPFWRRIIHFRSAQNSIVITLPHDVIEDLAVSSDVADISISGQKLHSLSVKQSSADVFLSDCEGEDFQIENANGNIQLKNVAASLRAELQNGDLEILNGSGDSLHISNQNGKAEASGADYTQIDAASANGDINLQKVQTDSITLSNKNGNVSLELAGEQALFDYDITNHNGKVMIGENTVGTFHTEFKFSNDAGKQITADLNNGDLTVTFLGELQE